MAERLSKVLPIRIRPSTWARLTRLAARRGKRVSAVAREALEHLVDKEVGEKGTGQ